MSDLREQLADLEHERWSGWMRYVFSLCTADANGCMTMPVDKVKRWTRQAHTPYASLSEREKDSDRIEADKTLALVANEIRVVYRSITGIGLVRGYHVGLHDLAERLGVRLDEQEGGE